MKSRILTRETTIDKPIEEVFSFFSKAENLDLITPSHLNFKTLTPSPIKMHRGTIIEYQLKLYLVPFRWKTEITEWEPPHKFTDTQLKGPYIKWIHQHTFKSLGNSTIMSDKIEYLSPGWILEPLIHNLFVKNKVEEIFNYRNKNIKQYLK